jgi:hypothetical protein
MTGRCRSRNQLPPWFAKGPYATRATERDDRRSRRCQGSGRCEVRRNAKHPIAIALLNSDNWHVRVLPDGRDVFRAVDAQAGSPCLDCCLGDPANYLCIFKWIARIRLTRNHQFAVQMFLNLRDFHIASHMP